MSGIDYLADTNAIISLLDGNSLRTRLSILCLIMIIANTILDMVFFVACEYNISYQMDVVIFGELCATVNGIRKEVKN